MLVKAWACGVELAGETMALSLPGGGDRVVGRLSIGAMESTASTRLPPLMADFHRLWPRVDLEISVGTSASLAEDVRHSRIDCAFVASSIATLASACRTNDADARARVANELDSTYAYTEELLLVLPASHAPVSSPDELAISTMAVFADGCTYRRLLERWLASAPTRADRARHWDVIEQTSYHGILTRVAAGSCIAVCPRSVIDAQRAMAYVRTHSLGTIDTLLISRSASTNAAYGELLRAVRRAPRCLMRAGKAPFIDWR